ncbi:hypothetical protein N898_11390 [Salmonella enterica subsp. arizonae serovar 62:z36:- str. RKS2983]|nr:hypothetical protein N898_11390 [Salmonella enterica subsp. arizonae serovar 62:z36:- str. RKS2983]
MLMKDINSKDNLSIYRRNYEKSHIFTITFGAIGNSFFGISDDYQ